MNLPVKEPLAAIVRIALTLASHSVRMLPCTLVVGATRARIATGVNFDVPAL